MPKVSAPGLYGEYGDLMDRLISTGMAPLLESLTYRSQRRSYVAMSSGNPVWECWSHCQVGTFDLARS